MALKIRKHHWRHLAAATGAMIAMAAPGHGIGAGPACDGQVLVSTDLVGLLPDPPPFVAPRANVRDIIRGAAAEFAADLRADRWLAVERQQLLVAPHVVLTRLELGAADVRLDLLVIVGHFERPGVVGAKEVRAFRVQLPTHSTLEPENEIITRHDTPLVKKAPAQGVTRLNARLRWVCLARGAGSRQVCGEIRVRRSRCEKRPERDLIFPGHTPAFSKRERLPGRS